MKKIMKPLLFLLILFIITGCEQVINIRFPSEENWEIESSADFDKDIAQGLGEIGGSLFESFLGSSLPNSLTDPAFLIKMTMPLYETQLEKMGVDFDWSYDNNKLKLKLSGTSFEQLTTVPIDYFSLAPIDDGVYRLTINYEYLNEYINDYLGEEFLLISSAFYNTEVSVSARKIIDSNADKETNTKATWYNPSMVDVTFIPGSPANINIVLFIIGLVIVAVIVILKVKKRI